MPWCRRDNEKKWSDQHEEIEEANAAREIMLAAVEEGRGKTIYHQGSLSGDSRIIRRSATTTKSESVDKSASD
jgi:hypothetical protein